MFQVSLMVTTQQKRMVDKETLKVKESKPTTTVISTPQREQEKKGTKEIQPARKLLTKWH